MLDNIIAVSQDPHVGGLIAFGAVTIGMFGGLSLALTQDNDDVDCGPENKPQDIIYNKKFAGYDK